MGIPTLITITGTVRNVTGPLSGRLVFASSTLVRDNTTNDVMTPDDVVAVVGADGELSVQVPATDDPNFSPTGWTWEVRPHFPNWKTPFSVAIPYDSPNGMIDLSDLVEIPPNGDGELYALINHTHAGGGGGGDLDPASTVVSETTYGQSATAGNATTYARGNHTHGTPALPTAAAIGAATSAHTHSGIYDPAGAAEAAATASASALASHEADTTAVHGIANTASLILEGDARLTDARTPTTHSHTAAQISDATATGRSVLTAADAAAARTAIGAGTSNLTLGTTGSTAAAGDAPASAITAHEAAANPHPNYTSIYYWNGSSYDLVAAAAVYVGGTGPSSPVNGDVWFP